MRPWPQILLVDDNPADVELVCDTATEGRYQIQVRNIPDGEKAMAYLRRSGSYGDAARPNLIILDLNLPRKDGKEVLREMKRGPSLRSIPVIIFSTSRSDSEVRRCYELGANCYVNKPGNLGDFVFAIRSIKEFWFGSASLPEESNDGTAVCARVTD